MEAEGKEKLLNVLTKSQKCSVLLVGFVGRSSLGNYLFKLIENILL